MQEIWGWLPAIDLFLGGLGAGAFLIAAIVELTGERYKHDFCPTTLVGAGIGGPAVILGTIFLIFDLGAGKRELWRIFYMYTHFTSVMTWGTWTLSIFIPLAFLYGFLELMDVYPQAWSAITDKLGMLARLPVRRTKRIVVVIGSVFALGTALYTGILISGVGPAIPFWSTTLPLLSIPVLPVLFLVSALSTGLGLTIDLAATIALPEVQRRFHGLPIVHLILIGLETALLGLFLILALNAGGAAAESARSIISGEFRISFWVAVVLPGLVYPILSHAYALGAGRHSVASGIGSGVGIVVARLFLRYVIMAAGIPATL